MKKHLFGFLLLLLSACQTVTATPSAKSTPTSPPPPTPIPATPTQTFTPAPTSSPTPVPLYFSDEFNAPDTTAWNSFQTGGATAPTLAIENGLLRLDIPAPHTWFYAIHNAHDYQNVTISAKFSSAHSGSAGLVCYYSKDGWLEFNLASDGTYTVLFGQLLAEGIANYLPIASAASEYLAPGAMDYEIGLTCQPDFLSLFINGKLFRKLDVTRFKLESGQVGVTASSFDEAPAIVTFDWFKVDETQ
ncbi:MAG: hypothetical protein IT310_01835 [Anaerolineales bacterium]|nr:hypothetical protein [Anaerolineales bacterium]